ncbi:MAG TPA: hypothetical protein VMZ73_08340 [Acidimicrobiales bacterium]|nr:hypothetical protein [Acidimicrobiales bacterium]
MKVIEYPEPPRPAIPVDLVVVRGVLRATFDHPVDPRAVNQRLAMAWSDVVRDLSGDADIVRVAGALDPRWRTPGDPPPNRATMQGDRWRHR